MAKKTNPKKKEETTCRQLSELQTEDLARLIISEAGCTDISRGTNGITIKTLDAPIAIN